MYRIGIVDDVESDQKDIQVAIWDTCEDKSTVQFKIYELQNREKDKILAEIADDVTNNEIQALIVDFRLDTTADVIEGWQIVEFVHKETPEFPMVILTNVPTEGKESRYTDADKVYAKSEFLRTSSRESGNMVKNIFLNMKHYVENRKRLEAKLETELQKLDENSTDEEILRQVMELETQLSGYKKMNQTTVDASLDLSDLKDALGDLKKWEELLGNG